MVTQLSSRLHTAPAQITRIIPSEYTLNSEYTVLKSFSAFRIFEQLALAWKTVCPEIFHCIEYIFSIQDFWATLHMPWKTEFALEFFTVVNMLFTFRIFDQLCACPEKESVPCIRIHCIEYIFFIIQDFWGTSAWPENRVCPENFQARGAAASSAYVWDSPRPGT